MARNVTYYDREGRQIDSGEWTVKRSDETYRNVRQYDNGTVRVILVWMGKVTDAASMFRDYWPVFQMGVWNYDAADVLRPDPIMNENTFGDEDSAVKAYEQFLMEWTDCMKADGVFTEADNDLTPPPPPPPPNLDAPTSEVSTIKGFADDGVGAW